MNIHWNIIIIITNFIGCEEMMFIYFHGGKNQTNYLSYVLLQTNVGGINNILIAS